jgi:thiol-disulfide isomerase/thioredoxin
LGARRAALLLLAALTCVAGLATAQSAPASDEPVVLVFYEEGCPNCAAVEELLVGLAADLPPDAIRRYEISDTGNLRLLKRLEEAYGIDVSTVPVVFVGDQVIVGAGRAQEFKLRAAIGDCATVGCPSPLDRLAPAVPLWKSLVKAALFAVLVVALALLQLP